MFLATKGSLSYALACELSIVSAQGVAANLGAWIQPFKLVAIASRVSVTISLGKAPVSGSSGNTHYLYVDHRLVISHRIAAIGLS